MSPTDPQPTEAADDEVVATPPRHLRREVWIVLGLSLGQSAIYAVIDIVGKLTEGRPLADQQATLNQSVSPRPLLDLSYQLAGIVFALVPVLLAVYLLGRTHASPARMLGIDTTQPARDLGFGVLLAAVIGIPGLGLYFAAKAIGINATVVASGLYEHWWTVPILILAAAQNAILEEIVVVGYLMTRLRQFGWTPGRVLIASALLRGTYHLYQGFGGFIGNVVMGLVFGWFYQRKGRVAPLIVAHTVLDVVAFVGYALLKDLLGLP